jgi:hypothetical protein
VGIVWTDGLGTTLFEAFDAFGAPIEVIGPVAIADGSINGETAEDRFFGASHSGGISSVRISNTIAGMEVDHLQYGGIVPDLPGCITIEKNTDPPGGTGFLFSWGGPTGPLAVDSALSDGQSRKFCGLAPGNYSFSELVPSGWILTNIVCVGGPGFSFFDLSISEHANFTAGDIGVTFSLAASQNVICTFFDCLKTLDQNGDTIPDTCPGGVPIQPVGGTAELVADGADPSALAAESSGRAVGGYASMAGLVAAIVAVLTLSAWYVRRRRLE